MAYTPKTWKNGEVINADDLNHLELGIAGISSGGNPDGSETGGIGKSMTGETVSPEYGVSATAGVNAEIFNDYRERSFFDLYPNNPSEGNVASGEYSHAEGAATTASGKYSHAEGRSCTASGESSHAGGEYAKASGRFSHAEGVGCIASDDAAHAEGYYCEASGTYSHAEGEGTVATKRCQHALGSYNVESATNVLDYLIVGKGVTNSSRANCFRVNGTAVFGSGAYNSSGADYAELFEWADGNPGGEDRAGRFVTLSGDKIRLADPTDDFILGIVSGSPSVVGDVHDDQWQGMYLRDIFGRPLWDDVEVPDKLDQDGNVIIPAHTEHRQKLNPAYDGSKKYQPRSQRSEWDAVGMLGKLVAVDDGTCEANGWAAVGDGGIAVASKVRTRYRVMARLDDTHVKILIL